MIIANLIKTLFWLGFDFHFGHKASGFCDEYFTYRSDESSTLATLAADKKMSDPRRTFCLFVTFDFILTFLLWLIEIGVSLVF